MSTKNTKFIGVDGFEPIDSLNSKKNRKPVHSPQLLSYRARSASFKKAALSVAASVTAAVLCCATVASALEGPKASAKQTALADAQLTVPATEQPQQDNTMETEPELMINSGCADLYIDGKLIGSTDEPDALAEALEQNLKDSRKGYDDATVTEYVNKIKIDRRAAEENEKLLSAAELMKSAKKKLSVKLTTDWSYDLDIDYDVKYEYDESQDNDYREVVSEGEEGTLKVNVKLIYIDGEYQDSELVNTKTIKKPVNEVIMLGAAQGVKEPAEGEAEEGTTGNFIWPVTHTTEISSYFEERWGTMHTGIDIAGGDDYGQPIIASDGGTVSFAGDDDSGYGNYVIIDHDNGYQTLYGHCSELAVSEGQTVNQGDTIAYVGSTGYSTGPHLHFEVRLDDERLDPLQFVEA